MSGNFPAEIIINFFFFYPITQIGLRFEQVSRGTDGVNKFFRNCGFLVAKFGRALAIHTKLRLSLAIVRRLCARVMLAALRPRLISLRVNPRSRSMLLRFLGGIFISPRLRRSPFRSFSYWSISIVTKLTLSQATVTGGPSCAPGLSPTMIGCSEIVTFRNLTRDDLPLLLNEEDSPRNNFSIRGAITDAVIAVD